MKIVRVMLAAIAVLGIVGGALAFKAKTFSSERFCYRLNNPGLGISCATLSITVTGLGTYYITPTVNCANCTLARCSTRILKFESE